MDATLSTDRSLKAVSLAPARPGQQVLLVTCPVLMGRLLCLAYRASWSNETCPRTARHFVDLLAAVPQDLPTGVYAGRATGCLPTPDRDTLLHEADVLPTEAGPVPLTEGVPFLTNEVLGATRDILSLDAPKPVPRNKLESLWRWHAFGADPNDWQRWSATDFTRGVTQLGLDRRETLLVLAYHEAPIDIEMIFPEGKPNERSLRAAWTDDDALLGLCDSKRRAKERIESRAAVLAVPVPDDSDIGTETAKLAKAFQDLCGLLETRAAAERARRAARPRF